jgi:hypothetical protein
MDKTSFYKLYLLALDKSLKDYPPNLDYGNDTFIKSPEYYMSEEQAKIVDDYLSDHEDDYFLNQVAYYYDALTHGFKTIGSFSLEIYYNKIIEELNILKKKYEINI